MILLDMYPPNNNNIKISELKNAPKWLKDATVRNEDVEITTNGVVVWKGGVWIDGVWEGGGKM